MFDKIPVKILKKLISEFKKANNVVGNVSKLKKKELVEILTKHFVLENDKLVLKKNKRQAPTPVAPPAPVPIPPPTKQAVPAHLFNNNLNIGLNPNGLTAGQQRFTKTVNQIENRMNARDRYLKDNNFSKRILKK